MVVPTIGIFEVQATYTTPPAPATFDRLATDSSGQSVFKQVFGTPPGANYDIAFAVIGPLPTGLRP